TWPCLRDGLLLALAGNRPRGRERLVRGLAVYDGLGGRCAGGPLEDGRRSRDGAGGRLPLRERCFIDRRPFVGGGRWGAGTAVRRERAVCNGPGPFLSGHNGGHHGFGLGQARKDRYAVPGKEGRTKYN